MATRFTTPEEGWNQNKQRSVAIFFDNHKHKNYPNGRGYWCYVENPADPSHQKRSVGELIPITADMVLEDGTVVKGWSAPWVPEQKYFAMAMSMINGNTFRWNYVRMIADYKEASDRYYRRCAQEAAARNWPAPKLYGDVSFQLRAVCGERPKSPKVPEAAQAEDPWLLGFDQRPNEKIKKILEDERGSFGVTLEEAGIDEVTTPAQTVTNGLTQEEIDDFRAFRLAQQQKKAHSDATKAGMARRASQTDAKSA
jgi:hypothetical protein